MTGLDTNVIVRYIVQDDVAQAGKATALIESLSEESPGFLSMTAVVELVWVIQGCYHASEEETFAILDRLLCLKTLRLENAEVMTKALRVYAGSNVDFADCLIERSGNHANCSHTMTFDGKAAKAAGMQLLG
ncbi:MAG: type II toxin-antitoxin system VapC family toxin [Noviherbaspirillum sp.]